MGQTTLGLDIGQYAIKGIRIAQTLRGLRWVDSFERRISSEDARGISQGAPLGERQIEALERLLSEGKIKRGERIAVSLPGYMASTREITLPFADPKRLRQLVPYEVEGRLPFDLEEGVIDYQFLNRGPSSAGGAESHLLVSALPKAVLKDFLSRLQALGIDPAWVGLDSISLYTFYQYFSGASSLAPEGRRTEGQEDLLLIDVGMSKTVLCAVAKGTLKSVRSFPIGGERFTEALQKEFQLSWEEAEKLKEEIDLNHSDPAPYQQRGVERIREAMTPWLTEIEMSIRGAETPASFYLCGGGGALRGLRETISERLQMEPISLEPARVGAKNPPLAGAEAIDRGLLGRQWAQGIGSALASIEGSRINFRQGEFAFGKETLEKRNKFVSMGLVFLLILGLMGGDFYLHYHKKEDHYQKLKGGLRSAFARTFPQTKNILNEVEQIRAAVADLNRTGGFLGVGEENPLEVLKEVTAAIPKEIQIDVQEMVIDGNKIRIEAQTDSYESVDRIRGGLIKGTHFETVSVGDAKAGADPSKVRFRIQMSVTEKEKSERKGSS